MTIWRVEADFWDTLASKPETAMDIQIGRIGPKDVAIVGCRLVIAFDQNLPDDLVRRREVMGPIVFKLSEAAYRARFMRWFNELDPAPEISLVDDPDEARAIMGVIHGGARPGAVTSSTTVTGTRPMRVYGHLPHQGTCDGSDVFYRYEAFPTSLRIDQATGRVTRPDTYAAPESEAPFTPTGLSAVGRFALPSLDPHRWRWRLQPVMHTPVYYGASVPLYGQAGGAVEVMFPAPFQTAAPIPNPTVLDIL